MQTTTTSLLNLTTIVVVVVVVVIVGFNVVHDYHLLLPHEKSIEMKVKEILFLAVKHG